MFRQAQTLLPYTPSEHCWESLRVHCKPNYWSVWDWDEDVRSKATANPKMLVISSAFSRIWLVCVRNETGLNHQVSMDWCKEEKYRRQEAMTSIAKLTWNQFWSTREVTVLSPHKTCLMRDIVVDGLKSPLRLLLVASPLMIHPFISFVQFQISMAGLRDRGDL